MSRNNARNTLRQARRKRCSAILSEYLNEHPKTVSPEVALRFLQFGRHAPDLRKFLHEDAVSKSVIQVPEHIKKQARDMFAPIQAARRWRAVVQARLEEKRRQRAARKIHRRARA